MTEKTKLVSTRLKSAKIKQLQARASVRHDDERGAGPDIRTGLASDDNKALAKRLMRIERRRRTAGPQLKRGPLRIAGRQEQICLRWEVD